MEPRQQGPIGGAEKTPAPAGGYEIGGVPELMSAHVEVLQTRPEVGSIQAEAAQSAMPALPTPVIPSQPSGTAPVVSDDDVPIVANDDDLIEKEWVDKAKKIISETRDDPYARERAISKLQIEYIRRRYGREIGDSGD